ncbi:hypothetical protein CPB83DRAFT_856613 [Crepidotus variabilis]|uniref:Uncharacterized protein n=1 Tax=Crepidotus variabilis TaxID=179855 RepID=A0A9P6EDT6_9AGAR|nr:hypothetical protein CPB83DRAFT_856613 [Crepidotus variabilis]
MAVKADWQASFTYADGGQITAHGFVNSGCVNLFKTDSQIVTVFLEGNINVDTIELFNSRDCNGLAYTGGTGSSNPPDGFYPSYQVY